MTEHKVIIRIMGESDIIDVEMMANATTAPHALLDNVATADQVNLLGHWVDQDRGADLADDAAHLDAMTIMASAMLQSSPLFEQVNAGANFALLTILREKWPVGSKAKFKAIADRVQAEHTYLLHICAPLKQDDLDDDDALKQAETQQLADALAFYKTNRRRFANSSAVQGLIRS